MDTLICWKSGKCIILLLLLFLRQNSLLLSTKFHKSRILWGKRWGWIPICSSPAFSRSVLSLLQPIITILSLNCNTASMWTIQIIIWFYSLISSVFILFLSLHIFMFYDSLFPEIDTIWRIWKINNIWVQHQLQRKILLK